MKIIYIARPKLVGPIWEIGLSFFHGMCGTYTHATFVFNMEDKFIRTVKGLHEWEAICKSNNAAKSLYHFKKSTCHEANRFLEPYDNLVNKFNSIGIQIPYSRRTSNNSLAEIVGIRYCSYREGNNNIFDISYEF